MFIPYEKPVTVGVVSVRHAGAMPASAAPHPYAQASGAERDNAAAAGGSQQLP
jgi:hypothetical protein